MTEADLKSGLQRAICNAGMSPEVQCTSACPCNNPLIKRQTESALAFLNAPPDVLSWVSAHPEAAKGLAEGTMVAVPKLDIRSPSTIEELEAILNSEDPAPVTITADGRVVTASTPVPSDEAQGETT